MQNSRPPLDDDAPPKKLGAINLRSEFNHHFASNIGAPTFDDKEAWRRQCEEREKMNTLPAVCCK